MSKPAAAKEIQPKDDPSLGPGEAIRKQREYLAFDPEGAEDPFVYETIAYSDIVNAAEYQKAYDRYRAGKVNSNSWNFYRHFVERKYNEYVVASPDINIPRRLSEIKNSHPIIFAVASAQAEWKVRTDIVEDQDRKLVWKHAADKVIAALDARQRQREEIREFERRKVASAAAAAVRRNDPEKKNKSHERQNPKEEDRSYSPFGRGPLSPVE